MSDATLPIDPDETILRRIPVTPGYFDPEKAPPVQAGAFRPNKGDTDGISFYRERQLSAYELVAATNKAAGHFRVARMVARDLLAAGLALHPKQEEGDLPGHVIAPEINHASYNDPDMAKRQHVKEVCKKLADLANRPGVTFDPHTGGTDSQ